MKEAKIDNFIGKLHSRLEVDTSIVKQQLNLFLSDEYSSIVHYINNALFVNSRNILTFLRSSINQGSKNDDDLRKLIYQFLSQYISLHSANLVQYIQDIFAIIHSLFNIEHNSKPKQYAIAPLIAIIDAFEIKILISQKVLDPQDLHNALVNILKCQKFTPNVKGQVWLLTATLQGKFGSSINLERRRQVQQMCLFDLKNLINQNKNYPTIAAILRSFVKSLEQVLLGNEEMKQLFKFVTVLILPLSTRYQVPINALQLLNKRSGVFHKFILEQGIKLFDNLSGLMNNANKQFSIEVTETIDEVVKQIVRGIQENPHQYERLYQYIIDKAWKMLKDGGSYEIKGTQSIKQKYKYNIITILKILGSISPLVKQFQTPDQLQRFFNHILNKCSKKIAKAFEIFNKSSSGQDQNQQIDEGLNNRNKMHIKFILYNQKQLISFISALSQIIYNIHGLKEQEQYELLKIILIAIEQYSSFHENYLSGLTRVLVEIFKVLQIKCSDSFYHLLKKIISSGYRLMLDSKKFNINTDDEYYQMIRKTTKLWLDLINHESWSGNSLSTFGNILFDFFETMIENLDISYKSNLQLELEQSSQLMDEENADDQFNEHMNKKKLQCKNQQQDLAKIFFLSSETMKMSNIQEYHYMCGLVLVFEGILSQLTNFNYCNRVFQFFSKVTERIRVFPKSVPLMKVIRALNNYLVKINMNENKNKSSLQSMGRRQIKQEAQIDKNIQIFQLNQFCIVAKKLYFDTIDNYLQKHQEECLYECLKMLTSFPVEVYFYQNFQILKSNLSYIIKKCFQFGQQILSLANSAIQCLSMIFEVNKIIAQRYLIEVIPKMQKFIWFTGQNQQELELESSKKIYVFLSQLKITKQMVVKKIMDFLGSIGGLSHLLVDNCNMNFTSWDYQDPLQISVLMSKSKYGLNLSKVISRICFLAINGQYNIKRASCQFIHSIITFIVGKSATSVNININDENKKMKQITANFLDKLFPTVLEIASNSSHPSQQLIHTILIQSIRFFAHTKQPNSPDISVILKHLLLLYNGTEDMSCLSSRCIAQLVRWHIKSDLSKKAEHRNHSIIKVIMRNIWTLTSNKKAKDGLILLLVELLRQMHRQQDLMKQYSLEICSIIISIGRSNQPIEKQFGYLITKLVLSLNRVIRKLIIQDKRQGDQYKKYPTIHSFLASIYQNNFFSMYSQQRQIAFVLWRQIINKYESVLNYSCQQFLKMRADRSKLYLFSKIIRPTQKFHEKQYFNKELSKIIGICDVWRKLSLYQILPPQKLRCFKDIEDILIKSYVNLNHYLISQFQQQLSQQERCFSQQIQKNFILSLQSLPNLLKQFKSKNDITGEWLETRFYELLMGNQSVSINLKSYIQFILKIAIKPSLIIPNFDYDIFDDPNILNQNNSILRDNKSQGNNPNQNSIQGQNKKQEHFIQVMINFLFSLSKNTQNQDILSIFFNVIQKIHFCSEKKLIKFIFSRSQGKQVNIYGFSSSFIEQFESQKNEGGSYIYERQIKTILRALQALSKHYPKNYERFANLLVQMINFLKNEEQPLSIDKQQIILQSIFEFAEYDVIKKYFLQVIQQMGNIFLKFQKLFLNFLVKNFDRLAQDLVDLCNKQSKILKLFYIPKNKLTRSNLAIYNQVIKRKFPQLLLLNQENQRHLYKLHYLCVQSITGNIEQESQYFGYLSLLLKQGLNIKKNSEIHFLTINLASSLLGKLKKYLKPSDYSEHKVKQVFDKSLISISNYYVPFTLGELKKDDQISNAERYLRAIQKLIYFSKDFKYSTHLFIGFKDSNLKGKLKSVHESIIHSIIAKIYNQKQPSEQYEIAEWLLGYFDNEQLNNKNNIWNSFRLAIIQRFFVKIIHFTEKKTLIKLFHKYTPILINIISEKVTPKNVQDMVVEFQIKKGAFIIIEHLYMYLPKPQKDKTLQRIHTEQHHKKIIPKIIQVLKKRFDNSSMILMNEHDKNSSEDQKALDFFRNYMNSAYNCLIVIFISTQSKIQHFKKYLFDKGQVLWQHLMDPSKVSFNFPIETEFQLMKPIEAISKYQHKSDKDLYKKIKQQYMMSSLYVIDEEENADGNKNDNLEQENSNKIVEENNQIKEGSIEKVLSIQLEEDYINQHSCMVNILRVIDYMYRQFYDGKTPIWMQSIYNELDSQDLPLSVRIFLTKIILNRPQIFTQYQMWGNCLMKYLICKQNGGSYIHYFYRDVLVKLLRYMKDGFKPDVKDVNFIVMKMVRCLPHDKNMMIYSSNIDILEELMKLVPGIYIQKSVITKMLASGKDNKKSNQPQNPIAEKNRYQWRMCACIIMKSCLIFKIPILTEEQWISNKGNNKNQKFYYFTECLKNKLYKLAEDLFFQTVKKYRIAAAGLFGQLLKFFNQKHSSYVIKEEDRSMLNQYIKDVINNIYCRQQNRNTKERLSIVYSTISARYPMVLSDSKIFSILDAVIVKYKQDQRHKLFEAALAYISQLLRNQEKSYGFSVELMMTIRGNVDKFINDNFEVYRIAMKTIKQFAKPFYLESKEIFLALHSMFHTLDKNYANSQDQGVCLDFYEFVLSVKDFITLFTEQTFRLKSYLTHDIVQDFKYQIKQSLISGLGNKFNLVRKIILQHFQEVNIEIQSFESRIISLLKEIYNNSHQNLWIVNSIPLIFSIAKKSSQYNSFIFTEPIEKSAKYYDWDFKNIAFYNTSQPYTPSSSYFTNAIDRSQRAENQHQGSFIASLGSNRLQGMIRATQNSYMSQEEQVFTILASQNDDEFSSFNGQMSLNQRMEIEKNSDDTNIQEQRNYTNLNNIFMNNRRKNKVTQVSQNKNSLIKFESSVNLVGDNIRFKPKSKQGQAAQIFRVKKSSSNFGKSRGANKNNKKIHSSYRSYKLGQLPNIQISVANILEPLVEVCCFDKQVASQMFIIFLNEFTSKDGAAERTITDWFVQLLRNSRAYDFSFISTLQKSLIGICQKGNQMVKLSMNQIAIKSNTIDYAIVFTEQNLIRYRKMLNDKQKISIIIEDENNQKFAKTQWSDLIDLYQKISGHAFLPPMLKHITKQKEYQRLLKSLSCKQQGAISDCYKQLEELLKQTHNSRLKNFLQKQKIDCLALLGQWEPVANSLDKKIQSDNMSAQQNRLLTLSLLNLNSQKINKENILHNIRFPDERFDYQKALVALLDYNTDLADYFSGKQIQSFYKYFKKTTSFDFNSKHFLLENIQKIYEMREFLSIYRNKQPLTVEILDVMNRWSKRLPNDMFDSNLTWIEILQSRILYTNMLYTRFSISKQKVAKANTDYMIQVVNQMLKKNIYGCAEIITKKALAEMKQSQFFNWAFYQALSDLKLFQFKKKVIINPRNYQMVPKIIFKQLSQNKKADSYSDIKYLSIQNDHMEGFLQSCSKAILGDQKPNIQEMVDKIGKIFKNYERIKKSYKNLQKQNQVQALQLQKIECKIHFSFSLFLENILELTKGKNQFNKEIVDLMQKSNLLLQRLTQIFVNELIQSISLMNISGRRGMNSLSTIQKMNNSNKNSSTLNFKQKQLNDHKVFSMILKLLKTIQTEKSRAGQIFSQAINDKKIPIWIFVYFIPQIITALNSNELVYYFQDLFESILQMYPESLVYHFNCYYEKQIDCITDTTRNIFATLRKKLDVNFKFIDALELLYQPELRLKQILTRFTIPGEQQSTIEKLQEFMNVENKRLGKYNKKFIDQYKPLIRKVINLKRQQKSQSVARSQIQKLVKQLDAKNKENHHQRQFTKLSDGSLFFQDYNSNDYARIQVPATIYSKFQEPLSWNKVFIQSFDLSLITLRSQRKPKKITLYGSNQKKYMFLVKGGQDVRLDQRIQELFNIMNKIMRSDPQCGKKKLQIKRFEVIPLKKMLGIFEWIDESQTLKDVLQKELKQQTKSNLNLTDGNNAFKQYNQKVKSSSRNAKDNSSLYRQFLSLPEEQIVSNLKNCQSYMPFGLLRKTLLRLSKSYDFYLHIKNQFLSNYAVVCIVGYVLGIGDRHLENLLIHGPTASIILIDFGYSFGTGRQLSVPELIPFRLTKCFMQIMQPIGYQGIFKQAMINSFSAFQDNKNLIIDFCDVFIDDPLMQWIWKCKKEISANAISENISMTISQQPPQRKVYSKKIEYVQKKLIGQHPRKILIQQLQETKHRQAKFFDQIKKAVWKNSGTSVDRRNKLLDANQISQQLITLASDKNILGRCYIGLNPFV